MKFYWWNAFDFYHYDPNFSKKDRWPNEYLDYKEKCNRVDTALTALFKKFGQPDFIALGEITHYAARDLRDRLLSDYRLISLDVKVDAPSLQVAYIIRPDSDFIKFKEASPFLAEGVPRGSRPMAVIDAMLPNDTIRFVACHWNAKIAEHSEVTRQRFADQLATYAYRFLNQKSGKKHHLVILGDLNDEPHSIPFKFLNAHMHRQRSRSSAHWADHDVDRVHLYNCAWRFYGEANPHMHTGESITEDAAGTYYWQKNNTWSVIDHVIVSGGLLNNTPPYLNESQMTIAALPEFLSNGLPIAFSKTGTTYTGLSDHLPIFSEIIT